MSCSVPLSAWPMCSSPVTLGGGTAIENFGLGLLASALKSSASAHLADQRGSTVSGSYAGGIDLCSVIWACFYLGRGGRAGACGSLAGERRPGYAYVDLLAAHGQISLYPPVEGAEEALQVVSAPPLPGFERCRGLGLRPGVDPPGGVFVDRPPGTEPLRGEGEHQAPEGVPDRHLGVGGHRLDQVVGPGLGGVLAARALSV